MPGGSGRRQWTTPRPGRRGGRIGKTHVLGRLVMFLLLLSLVVFRARHCAFPVYPVLLIAGRGDRAPKWTANGQGLSSG